jgi:hypothetical protein
MSTATPLCQARIRPFPGDTEVACSRSARHDGMHLGTVRDYAYPGSATDISWDPADRRNFTGPWRPCPQIGCVLPVLHRGEHSL